MPPLLRDVVNAVRLADVVDVLLLASVLFVGIIWLRRSSSGSAARRVMALGLLFASVYLLADTFDLYLMERLLQVLFFLLLIAVVLVFQTDIRRMLDRIAAWSFSRPPAATTPESPAQLLTEAAARLAERRTGALIAIRGSLPWESYLHGGIELDGRVTRPLLYSIFHPESPGHDGAVLIEGDRVTRFAAHLPLATRLPTVSRYGGTRHAAALGLAEESDALVIVVSEERGTISVAEGGRLEEMESPAELGRRLERFWTEHYESPVGLAGHLRTRRTVGSAAMSLGLAVFAWFAFSFSGDTVYRSYEIPIEFRNLPPGWALERDTALTALVTLSGSEQGFRRLDPASLVISFDLARPVEGENELTITEDRLSLPSGLGLYDANPRDLAVGIERQVRVELPVRVRTAGVLADSLVLVPDPARVSILVSRDRKNLPEQIPTEPLDLSRIGPSGTVQVRLELPANARLSPDQKDQVTLRLERRRPRSP